MEDISASVASSVVEDNNGVAVVLIFLGLAAAGANADATAAVSMRVSRYFIVVVFLMTK